MQRTLAIVLGAGPGTGQALGLAFSAHHSVALLARNVQSLNKVTESIQQAGGDAAPFACDASSVDSLTAAFRDIRAKFPDHQLKVACFNANAPFIIKPFLDLKPEDMRVGLDLNVMGAFHFSQLAIPLMLQAGGGTLIFSGATAALRGASKFAAFSPSKFALRGLSQTIAREFGPQGIHSVHTILDGLIDTEAVGQFAGVAEKDSRLKPADIAAAYVYLSQQEPSCWTQELDLRPASEKW